MKFRGNKGITGTDISVALIIIVLFTGLITTLVYNFSTTSKGINRKSDAINIAIQTIENVKQTEYEELQSKIEYKDTNGQTVANSPYRVETEVIKYSESDYVQNMSVEEKSKLQDIIKIVKVIVIYTVQTDEQKVELSTVITKGD